MSRDVSGEAPDGERWTAAGDEMQRRRALTKQVETTLSRGERETTLSLFGDDDRFQIITYKPTMVATILRHGYARIEWAYVMEDGERGRRVCDLSEIPPSAGRVRIEGICATLPVGALSLKGSPRTRDAASDVITTPDRAQNVAEVFADGGEP